MLFTADIYQFDICDSVDVIQYESFFVSITMLLT